MELIDLKAQYQRLHTQIEARIQGVLKHGHYILGPEVAELEQRLADYVGVSHCVAVSDGTTALLLALMALGIGPSDEVITTPFTFVAPAEMIAFVGAMPIFVDIDPLTYQLDPNQIEAAITSKTRAILPVSLFGQCADLEAIQALADRYQLAVIEDAAQSFGAEWRRPGTPLRRSCGFSTIACTSFFPSKPLGCYGDAGACFTEDRALSEVLRQLRVHGQDQRYHHLRIGLNARMDTLQAAVLLAKMEAFESEIEQRFHLGLRYTAQLSDLVRTPVLSPSSHSVFAQYTIEVDNRAQVQQRLKAAGIPTAVHYPIPLHRQPAFAHVKANPLGFPHAENAAARVLSLPMHPYLDTASQDHVVATLRAVVEQKA